MRKVSLQTVEASNFKSYSSLKVDLVREPGLRLIFGSNEREPRLGANGSGKSSIWDAVEFCAGGRSVRGKRASELVTTGHKSTNVETTWLIDGEVRKIRRTYPPERVYVDGELADQATVDELLGMSRSRRLASVIFGQSMPLFIDLPVPERGDLLDEVLGLGFWLCAADLATARWNAANVDAQKIGRELARMEGALEELPGEDDLRAASDDFEQHRAEQIDEQVAARRVLDAEYKRARRELAAMPADLGEKVAAHLAELSERSARQRSEVAVLQADVGRIDEDARFFEENGECPSCGQEIGEDLARAHADRCEADRARKIQELSLANEALGKIREEVDAAMLLQREERERSRERRVLEIAVANKQGRIGIADNRIQVLREQVNTYEEQLDAVATRRAELDAQLAAKRAEEAALSATIGRLDFWRQGFRRVRVFCLSRVLRELEVETMGAARGLGLVGWHVGFTGETETKSGTVKLGIQAVVRSPEAKRDFDSFSPGEGQRVRLAASLGLASLIQRYSGVSYDLEVFDEPTAWMSEEGVDDLFETLRDRAVSRGKSIWVCDPRAGMTSTAFDEIWCVVKTDEGSRIEVVRADRSR